MNRVRNKNNIPENRPVANSAIVEHKNIFKIFDSTVGLIISIGTIFGFGYGTACIVCTLNHRMEIIELNMEHNKELESLKGNCERKSSKILTEEDFKEFMDNYNKYQHEKK